MNYLAHALLAASPAELRLGGLIGDFVKGPLDSAANAGLPPAVRAGVALHRRIDSFADGHAAFRHSRARVGRLRRRYAGVMVDMFYDRLKGSESFDFLKTEDTTMQYEKRNDSDPFGLMGRRQ